MIIGEKLDFSFLMAFYLRRGKIKLKAYKLDETTNIFHHITTFELLLN